MALIEGFYLCIYLNNPYTIETVETKNPEVEMSALSVWSVNSGSDTFSQLQLHQSMS